MYKVGIIGLGVGEKHIDGFEAGLAKVTHLCDFNIDKIAYLKKKYPDKIITGLADDILKNKDIDIVSIASFDNFHYQQILEAIKNKKHIFVEKPMCFTIDELNDIKRKIPKEIIISSNLILRQTNRFKELKKNIQRNKLGKIYYIEASYDYGRIHKLLKGWRGEIKDYSVMLGGGIHLLDLALWITGSRVEEVKVMSSTILSKDLIMENPDFFTSIIRLKNGTILKLNANYCSATPHLHQFKVYGTEGSFFHDVNEGRYFSGRDTDCKVSVCVDEFPGTQKGDMIPNFLKSIDGAEKPILSKQKLFELMADSLLIDECINNA